jgi:hypothetical protein
MSLRNYNPLSFIPGVLSFASKCLVSYLAVFAAMQGAQATAYSESTNTYRIKAGLACDGNEVFIPPYGDYTFNIPFSFDTEGNCTSQRATIIYSTDYVGKGGIFALTGHESIGEPLEKAACNDYSLDGFLTKDKPAKECVPKAKCSDWEPTFWIRTERCSTTQDGKVCEDAIRHDKPTIRVVCTTSNS